MPRRVWPTDWGHRHERKDRLDLARFEKPWAQVNKMLAFDLETTGPDRSTDAITCAAVYDPEAGIERYFIFSDDAGSERDDPEDFMKLLDQASRLCAFNGARFDIPLIERCFVPDAGRVRAWRLKLHDVFEACKLALDLTFTLQSLLELNGIDGKTGSGTDAIQFALDKDWQSLGDYCLNDTKKTYHVSLLPRILLPKTHGSLCLGPDGLLFTQECQVLGKIG